MWNCVSLGGQKFFRDTICVVVASKGYKGRERSEFFREFDTMFDLRMAVLEDICPESGHILDASGKGKSFLNSTYRI